jgi:hypothetical protein
LALSIVKQGDEEVPGLTDTVSEGDIRQWYNAF